MVHGGSIYFNCICDTGGRSISTYDAFPKAELVLGQSTYSMKFDSTAIFISSMASGHVFLSALRTLHVLMWSSYLGLTAVVPERQLAIRTNMKYLLRHHFLFLPQL